MIRVVQVHLSRIDIVAVGTPGSGYEALIGDYERRLGRYVTLRTTVVRGVALERGEPRVLAEEADRLDRAIDVAEAATAHRTLVVACDSRGRDLTTGQLAERLLAERHLCLVIGGAAGLHERVGARASLAVSLGRITLPHQLARLVATEQLYRSFRIARGEPYHH